MIRVNNYQHPVFKPYGEATLEIYLAGCTNRCNGCCNPELHDFTNGMRFMSYDFCGMIMKNDKFIKNIAVLGGDLLCQTPEDINFFCNCLFEIKEQFNKKLWLFTGKLLKEVPQICFSTFDFIKCGKYIKELHQDNFPASTNQKLYKKDVDY